MLGLVLVACMEKSTGGDSDPAAVDSRDGTEDDTATPTPWGPPCEGGASWGAILDPEASTHVSADSGSDAGSGALDSPLATLAAAVAVGLAGGSRAIAVWPGRYEETLTLGPSGEGAYDGFSVTGCSADETILVGEDAEVLHVVGARAVSLSNLTIEGGERSLRVSAGADVIVTDLIVTGATGAAVVMDGVDTVRADRLTIADTAADGDLGIGLLVDGATVELVDSAISGSVGVGVLLNGSTAEVTMSGVDVSDTAQTRGGRLGRGVQVQLGAIASLTGCVVSRSSDAGVFAMLAPDLSVVDTLVDGIAAARADDDSATGDGIVITTVDGEFNYDPSAYPATVSGVTVSGWDEADGRAGIYVESAAVVAEGNAALGSDGTNSFIADDPGLVSGADASQFQAGVLSLYREIPTTP